MDIFFLGIMKVIVGVKENNDSIDLYLRSLSPRITRINFKLLHKFDQ